MDKWVAEWIGEDMEKSRELDTPLSAKELEDKEQRGQRVCEWWTE